MPRKVPKQSIGMPGTMTINASSWTLQLTCNNSTIPIVESTSTAVIPTLARAALFAVIPLRTPSQSARSAAP